MALRLPELIVIFVVALLVFGPKRLPEMGAQIGKSLNAFKKGMSELTDTTSTSLSSTIEADELGRLEARRLELDILEREIALKKAQAELGESNGFASSSYDSATTVEADYKNPETTYEASYPALEPDSEAEYVKPETTYEASYSAPETTAETYHHIAPTKLEEPVAAPVEVEAEAVTVPVSRGVHTSSGASTQAE